MSSETIVLDIVPVPKPRQTKSDKWKQRPSVMRYRAFADELRLKLDRGFNFNGAGVEFTIPMPKSWSKRKKAEMDRMPHTATPDLDNLLKALLDAHMGDDAGIHTIRLLAKTWGYNGSICITPCGADLPW